MDSTHRVSMSLPRATLRLKVSVQATVIHLLSLFSIKLRESMGQSHTHLPRKWHSFFPVKLEWRGFISYRASSSMDFDVLFDKVGYFLFY